MAVAHALVLLVVVVVGAIVLASVAAASLLLFALQYSDATNDRLGEHAEGDRRLDQGKTVTFHPQGSTHA